MEVKRFNKKFLYLFSFLIGYTIFYITLSGLKTVRRVNNSQYEDEEINKNLLRRVKAQKNVPVGNLNKKCYEQRSQYNATIDGEKYPKKVPIMYNTSIDFDCLNQQNNQTKIILSWNGFIDMTFDKETCPVKNCVLTYDRSFKEYADYVIFHGPDFDEPESLPPKDTARPDFQRWIFSVFESPFNTARLNAIIKDYDGVFNLTATYLEESDFEDIYELIGLKWERNVDFKPNQDFSTNKDGVVAALVSNCRYFDRTNRFLYLKELGKYTQVDIYGSCGMKCPVENCRDFLSKKYLFFFVAENSVCRDYITEKFFSAIRNNVVPIVLGGGDYGKYVPKSGFINALDFAVPSLLADYLNYLAANKTAYNEFFKWKQHVRFRNDQTNLICSMCIRLHLEDQFGIQPSVVKDLGRYWNLRNCKNPRTETIVIFKYDDYVDFDSSSKHVIGLLKMNNNQIVGYVLIIFVPLVLAFFYIKKRKS